VLSDPVGGVSDVSGQLDPATSLPLGREPLVSADDGRGVGLDGEYSFSPTGIQPQVPVL
jgi:hypothetical protein